MEVVAGQGSPSTAEQHQSPPFEPTTSTTTQSASDAEIIPRRDEQIASEPHTSSLEQQVDERLEDGVRVVVDDPTAVEDGMAIHNHADTDITAKAQQQQNKEEEEEEVVVVEKGEEKDEPSAGEQVSTERYGRMNGDQRVSSFSPDTQNSSSSGRDIVTTPGISTHGKVACSNQESSEESEIARKLAEPRNEGVCVEVAPTPSPESRQQKDQEANTSGEGDAYDSSVLDLSNVDQAVFASFGIPTAAEGVVACASAPEQQVAACWVTCIVDNNGTTAANSPTLTGKYVSDHIRKVSMPKHGGHKTINDTKTTTNQDDDCHVRSQSATAGDYLEKQRPRESTVALPVDKEPLAAEDLVGGSADHDRAQGSSDSAVETCVVADYLEHTLTRLAAIETSSRASITLNTSPRETAVIELTAGVAFDDVNGNIDSTSWTTQLPEQGGQGKQSVNIATTLPAPTGGLEPSPLDSATVTKDRNLATVGTNAETTPASPLLSSLEALVASDYLARIWRDVLGVDFTTALTETQSPVVFSSYSTGLAEAHNPTQDGAVHENRIEVLTPLPVQVSKAKSRSLVLASGEAGGNIVGVVDQKLGDSAPQGQSASFSSSASVANIVAVEDMARNEDKVADTEELARITTIPLAGKSSMANGHHKEEVHDSTAAPLIKHQVSTAVCSARVEWSESGPLIAASDSDRDAAVFEEEKQVGSITEGECITFARPSLSSIEARVVGDYLSHTLEAMAAQQLLEPAVPQPRGDMAALALAASAAVECSIAQAEICLSYLQCTKQEKGVVAAAPQETPGHCRKSVQDLGITSDYCSKDNVGSSSISSTNPEAPHDWVGNECSDPILMPSGDLRATVVAKYLSDTMRVIVAKDLETDHGVLAGGGKKACETGAIGRQGENSPHCSTLCMPGMTVDPATELATNDIVDTPLEKGSIDLRQSPATPILPPLALHETAAETPTETVGCSTEPEDARGSEGNDVGETDEFRVSGSSATLLGNFGRGAVDVTCTDLIGGSSQEVGNTGSPVTSTEVVRSLREAGSRATDVQDKAVDVRFQAATGLMAAEEMVLEREGRRVVAATLERESQPGSGPLVDSQQAETTGSSHPSSEAVLWPQGAGAGTKDARDIDVEAHLEATVNLMATDKTALEQNGGRDVAVTLERESQTCSEPVFECQQVDTTRPPNSSCEEAALWLQKAGGRARDAQHRAVKARSEAATGLMKAGQVALERENECIVVATLEFGVQRHLEPEIELQQVENTEQSKRLTEAALWLQEAGGRARDAQHRVAEAHLKAVARLTATGQAALEREDRRDGEAIGPRTQPCSESIIEPRIHVEPEGPSHQSTEAGLWFLEAGEVTKDTQDRTAEAHLQAEAGLTAAGVVALGRETMADAKTGAQSEDQISVVESADQWVHVQWSNSGSYAAASSYQVHEPRSGKEQLMQDGGRGLGSRGRQYPPAEAVLWLHEAGRRARDAQAKAAKARLEAAAMLRARGQAAMMREGVSVEATLGLQNIGGRAKNAQDKVVEARPEAAAELMARGQAALKRETVAGTVTTFQSESHLAAVGTVHQLKGGLTNPESNQNPPPSAEVDEHGAGAKQWMQHGTGMRSTPYVDQHQASIAIGNQAAESENTPRLAFPETEERGLLAAPIGTPSGATPTVDSDVRRARPEIERESQGIYALSAPSQPQAFVEALPWLREVGGRARVVGVEATAARLETEVDFAASRRQASEQEEMAAEDTRASEICRPEIPGAASGNQPTAAHVAVADMDINQSAIHQAWSSDVREATAGGLQGTEMESIEESRDVDDGPDSLNIVEKLRLSVAMIPHLAHTERNALSTVRTVQTNEEDVVRPPTTTPPGTPRDVDIDGESSNPGSEAVPESHHGQKAVERPHSHLPSPEPLPWRPDAEGRPSVPQDPGVQARSEAGLGLMAIGREALDYDDVGKTANAKIMLPESELLMAMREDAQLKSVMNGGSVRPAKPESQDGQKAVERPHSHLPSAEPLPWFQDAGGRASIPQGPSAKARLETAPELLMKGREALDYDDVGEAAKSKKALPESELLMATKEIAQLESFADGGSMRHTKPSETRIYDGCRVRAEQKRSVKGGDHVDSDTLLPSDAPSVTKDTPSQQETTQAALPVEEPQQTVLETDGSQQIIDQSVLVGCTQPFDTGDDVEFVDCFLRSGSAMAAPLDSGEAEIEDTEKQCGAGRPPSAERTAPKAWLVPPRAGSMAQTERGDEDLSRLLEVGQGEWARVSLSLTPPFDALNSPSTALRCAPRHRGGPPTGGYTEGFGIAIAGPDDAADAPEKADSLTFLKGGEAARGQRLGRGLQPRYGSGWVEVFAPAHRMAPAGDAYEVGTFRSTEASASTTVRADSKESFLSHTSGGMGDAHNDIGGSAKLQSANWGSSYRSVHGASKESCSLGEIQNPAREAQGRMEMRGCSSVGERYSWERRESNEYSLLSQSRVGQSLGGGRQRGGGGKQRWTKAVERSRKYIRLWEAFLIHVERYFAGEVRVREF